MARQRNRGLRSLTAHKPQSSGTQLTVQMLIGAHARTRGAIMVRTPTPEQAMGHSFIRHHYLWDSS